MKVPFPRLVLALIGLLMFASCEYRPFPQPTDGVENTLGATDSAMFRRTHHYWTDFNLICCDSLTLRCELPGEESFGSLFPADSVHLAPHSLVVVADVRVVPTDTVDSVWIKVAHSQQLQGWTRESDLLEHAVPDDPISQLINAFTGGRIWLFAALLGLTAAAYVARIVRHRRCRIVHFDDINSFYPTLFCLIVASAATCYGTLQGFAPETWVEFYFHPTLWPFDEGLPPILRLLIALVWLSVVIFVAVIEELHSQPDSDHTGFSYLMGMLAVCVVLYLVFSITTPLYVGYPLLAVYTAASLYVYFARHHAPYTCGHCGRPLKRLGRCTHCGTLNEQR